MKYRKLYILLVVMAMSLSAYAFPTSTYADHSALSSGKWVKIAVEKSGIYRITASDISKWGFSKISDIRIYGYGGKPISEHLTEANYVDDLPLVPVLRDGNNIVFYAQGVDSYSYNSSSHIWSQVQHPYDTRGYYFVTENASVEEPTWSEGEKADNGTTKSTFTDIAYHEKELYSPGQTGRRLYGEDFRYTSSQKFNISLPEAIEGEEATVTTAFGAKVSGGNSRISMKYNSTALEYSTSDLISAISSLTYDHLIYTTSNKTITVAGENLEWGIDYSYSGVLYDARLDYIAVNYLRPIQLVNGKLQFRLSGNYRIKIDNATAETIVLDVTDAVPQRLSGEADAGGGMIFYPVKSGEREYCAFTPGGTYSAPSYVGSVATQDLHGTATPDMVIVSPAEYLTQAQRIAALHESVDSMDVLVVTPEAVYNEFSSGTQDISAFRKMCKMFYDRGKADGGKFGYILLFARAHYDNRRITDKSKVYVKHPIIPTWESVNSENESSSFNTDDIITHLADNSGLSIAADNCEIAIGRIPVTSSSQAKEVVDKLYRYVQESNHSLWRNNILIIADDEDNAVHMSQSESLIEKMKSNGGEHYFYDRVYTDAFLATSSGTGRSYPDARTKMFRCFKDGVLWANYVGHANTVSWTHDGLLSMTDINNRFYYNNYPFLYTATCEFTRWDADELSGGEYLYLNPRGGVIGLISTSRVAYIGDNGVLNGNVAKYVFSRDNDGNYRRIGDILRLGKYNYTNNNKLRYSLIGDPAMRLVYPEARVVVETINGETVSSNNMPELAARSKATITGRIENIDGTPATDFNGVVNTRLFDAETSVTTHGYGDEGAEFLYYERSNTLFMGQDSVVDGRFTVKFNMPAEISNNYSPAMLNFYASASNGTDANGSNEQLYVWGYSDEVSNDTIGPEIHYCYLNNDRFANGDNVNESPMLIASFSDESGINISNVGIGHQMSATLDGKTQYTDLSQYFTPAAGNTGGTIAYPLESLIPGEHSIRFRVWDSLNNSSDTTLYFNVVEGLAPELYDVYAASPARTQADFYLRHNRPDAMITVTIEVFNLMGREVWSTTQTGKSDMFLSFPVTWDLGDNAGRRVSRGIYLYRASISTDGVQYSTKCKKIAVAAE